MGLEDEEVRARVSRVNALLERIEALPDAETRAVAAETLQGLVELYGEALARMMEAGARHGGEPLLRAWAEDELVSYLLLLHGLHPEDAETRARRALEAARGALQSRGHDAEWVGVVDGVARLRVRGGGCRSSAAELQQALEQAVLDAAPELTGAVCEEASTGFVALAALR